MICTHCQADSKKRERSSNKCPKCNHRFAFEAGDFISDAGFQKAIDAVSASGRVRWSPDHLYYEVARRKRPEALPRGCLILPVVLVGVGILSQAGGLAFFGVVIGLVMMIWRTSTLNAQTIALPRAKFAEMWALWQEVHGLPRGTLVPPKPAPPRKPKESDLGDYSFDRVVVCDRAETVDLLLANNFHFENNCAVLSIGGYPPGPFDTVMTMLRRNPRLKIYALHDATPLGCQLAHRLAHDGHWFRGHGRVIDVGLRPLHAGPFRGLFLPASSLAVDGVGIDVAEAEWLSKYALELAVIRPEQVVKRLFRAVNAQEDTADGDSGSSGGDGGSSSGSSRDDSSFSSDAGDGAGSSDGFG